MGIILDADVIIRGERGILDIGNWMRSLSGQKFEIAAVTVAELWHGAERAKGAYKARRLEYLEGLINLLPVQPYTERTAYEHARIWAELESRGKMIGYYDLIVAATALEHGHAVATFNHRHFSQVAALNIINPS